METMQRDIIVTEFKRLLKERSTTMAALKDTEKSGDVQDNIVADRSYAAAIARSEGFERGIIMTMGEEARDELRAEAVRQLHAERTT